MTGSQVPSAISTEQTQAVTERYIQAFQQHDASLLVGIIAEDCVMLNTNPAPDGTKYQGREACLSVWQGIALASEASFDIEEVIYAEDRAIVRWTYTWNKADEKESFRGLNILKIQNGFIVESLGYR